MFSLSWLRERGLTRARPSGRRRAAKAVALGALIAVTFLQTGCRSGGFGSGCGLFSPCGFPARATSRIMQPFKRVGGGLGLCGDGCGTTGCDAPMEYAGPVGVITPAVPMGAPATIVTPGGAIPSTVSPSSDLPSDLEPLPSAQPGSAPSRSGASSGVRRPSSYRPVQNPGVDLTGSVVSTPAPSRSTPTSTASKGREDSDSIFNNLPALDVPPVETPGRGDSPPVAPAAVKADDPAPMPTPTAASASPRDQAPGRAEGGSGPESPPATALAAAPAPDAVEASQGAVGVARFAAVDLKLAGGSVPSTVGLGWLAEKGYRTLLDLRDPSKIEPKFIGEASKRGLRYVSFPTDLATLDRERLDRFADELALDSARPLYFFDEDGRVAGALWYIRRVLSDKAAWDVARREAESIGLVDAAAWKATRDYVDSRLGNAPTAPTPVQAEDAKTAPAPRHPVQAAVGERVIASAAPAAPAALDPVPIPALPARLASDSADVWQPFAALLVTGLGFRLAFIGRSSIPTIRARTRASLPGPAPRS
jgi:hypothetical protein